MEIEKKYLIKTCPFNLENYTNYKIEQGYLSTSPVLRIRQKNTSYILTYKSPGLMSREEAEFPLTNESYIHLSKKIDGNIITKTRYLIPTDNSLIIELDIFEGLFSGLILAEVEFPTEDEANAYLPPNWFGKDVTFEKTYHNSNLSSLSTFQIHQLLANL